VNGNVIPDTISSSCGRACRLSSSARMLTTKPRTGRCFYTNFRTRPPPSTRPSSRCVPWSNTATTWSRLAHKPSTGSTLLLTHLTPAGASRGLTADRAADILRRIRPRETAARTLRSLAVDLVAEIRHLDRRIAKAATDIAAAVESSGSTLTELSGIGTLNAAKIIARVGTIDRFRSTDAFATYTGTAPIAASSGEVTRHRLSRAGDRQLNCCLHTMAISQIARDTPGRDY